MSELIYRGSAYGVGDDIELFMQYSRGKKTYVARDDRGVIILPELGSRMIGEMIEANAVLVFVKGKIIKIVETQKGTRYAIVRPAEWRPIETVVNLDSDDPPNPRRKRIYRGWEGALRE